MFCIKYYIQHRMIKPPRQTSTLYDKSIFKIPRKFLKFCKDVLGKQTRQNVPIKSLLHIGQKLVCPAINYSLSKKPSHQISKLLFFAFA